MNAPPLLSSITVVVAAAGKGVRFGSDVAKQYLDIDGKSVIEHALEGLEALSPKEIVLVVAADDEYYLTLPAARRCRVVVGGDTRAQSVVNALSAIDISPDDWVMVHDGARPCVDASDIARLIEAAAKNEAGGLLARRVIETVKSADEFQRALSTEDRDALWLAQTPQLFRFGLLKRAMADALESDVALTDESSALEFAGYRPVLVEGSSNNIKVTRPHDLELARWLLAREMN
ncbi:MAG: 2-C-methyl-D-erythritol 4-phosphate cytidylyltransferase [Gammaproteobacteria bacterium]|nr:2-C-methyl-D-erythritol 4-phosphate cytidylyltransferase [Gammaproteobacteria bacterium]